MREEQGGEYAYTALRAYRYNTMEALIGIIYYYPSSILRHQVFPQRNKDLQLFPFFCDMRNQK